eukprot:GHVU01125363.1.p1 GENE.GHVU01125363.1~~GHVU01125363.1.p1  ORF type:complete len:223 (+),score=34.55 GHVU01125363.1:121-789(+)
MTRSQRRQLKKKLRGGGGGEDEAYAPLAMPWAEDQDAQEGYANGDEGDEGDEDSSSLWWRCDSCKQGIPVGAKRYDCQTCEDFTLCKKCWKTKRHPHRMRPFSVPEGHDPPADYAEQQDAIASEAEKILNSATPSDPPASSGMRFKYINVAPCSYGLEVDEILSWSEKDLRQVISMKKLAPYREDAKQKQTSMEQAKYAKNKRQICVQKRKEEESNKSSVQR